jgi:hypothetical protein
MRETLVSCAGCARHVKESECVCPFCGERMTCGSVSPTTRPFARMAAAAVIAAGAVALSECSSSSSPSVVAFYGAVEGPDSGADSAGDGSTDGHPGDGSGGTDAPAG